MNKSARQTEKHLDPPYAIVQLSVAWSSEAKNGVKGVVVLPSNSADLWFSSQTLKENKI